MIRFEKSLSVVKKPQGGCPWFPSTGIIGIVTAAALFLLHTSFLQAQQPNSSSATSANVNVKLSPTVVTRDLCRFLTPVAVTNAPPIPPATQLPLAKKIEQKGEDDFGLKLPPQDHLFRLESEQAFRDRLRQELPKVKNVQFPKDVPLVAEAKTVQEFPHRSVGPVIDPVCYRPLYFEAKRAERFGQYVPCLQPLVSTSKFYFGVVTLPVRMISAPPWSFECDSR